MSKILILNTSFNKLEGSGVTVSNLFSFWNSNNLSNAAIEIFEDKSICNNYFKLKLKNNFIVENKNVGTQVLDRSSIESNSFIKSFFIGFKNILAILGIIDRIKIDSDFLSWVKTISPNVIYTVPYNHRDINFLLRINRKLKLPLIIHFYDDWINHDSRYGFFKSIFFPISNLLLKKLIKNSVLKLSISEKMKIEYEKRYKTTFHSFHNPVDISKWHISSIKNSIPENIFFIGTVGDHNFKEFEIFSKVISEINLKYKLSLKLHIFGYIRKQNIYEKLSSNSSIILNKPISHDMVPKYITKSDLLFLPLSFNIDQKNYIQYSMPTKTAEYMASGVPILVFSPKGFALTEYAEKKKWAYVVSVFSKKELSKIVMLFLNNIELKNQIISNAFSFANKDHEIKIVTDKLYNLINNCTK